MMSVFKNFRGGFGSIALVAAVAIQSVPHSSPATAAGFGCTSGTCGNAATCGFEEPVCGCEEPACGCEDPACGFEIPACGCDVPCGCDSMGGKRTLKDRFKSNAGKWKAKFAAMMSRKSKPSCDDGCDAMMIEQLSMPVYQTAPSASPIMHDSHYRPTMPAPIIQAPPIPHGNVRQRIDTGVVVPAPLRDNEPKLPGGQTMDSMELDRESLTDPFRDDGATASHPLRVRRASHRTARSS